VPKAWCGAALALLLALAACVPPDGETVATTAAVAPPAPRLSVQVAAQRLPAEAAAFRRGQTLPARPPATGQEVTYATPAARQRAAAVVKLAPVGADLPDGPASPAATAAFQAELNDAVQGRDRARNLHETRRFPLQVAGSTALTCAALEGSFGRQPVEGLVCAGAVGGNLVRLRVTMPKVASHLADAPAFASAIVAALQAR
jgi:hypothetical protein